MSGKLILIRANGTCGEYPWHKSRMPGQTRAELHYLQSLLAGAMLEHVRVRYENRIRDGFIDEEGKFKDLPDNMIATSMMIGRAPGDQIVGDLMIWVPDPKPSKSRTR